MSNGIETLAEAEKLFKLPQFRSALSDVALYTNESRHEYGFAAYKDASSAKFEISDIVSGEEQVHGDGFGDGHLSLNIDELVSTGEYFDESARKKPRIRNDIAFLLHSHPVMERERRTSSWQKSNVFDYVTPSMPDLEGDLAIEGSNPGKINGIMVAEGDPLQARILLYRSKNPNKPNMFGRLFGIRYGKDKAIEVLEDSGYGVGELLYNPGTKRYKDLGETLFKLF